MNDQNIATTRTTFTAVITAVALWGLAKLTGWEVSADDPQVIAIIGAGIPIVHRISTVLTELWPPLGFILFGIRTEPKYNQLPPPLPPA